MSEVSRASARARTLLLRLGARLSAASRRTAADLAGFLEFGAWLDRQGYDDALVVPTRADVFDLLVRAVAGRSLLYLEFGVHRGESLRWWAGAVPDARASFLGFDTFTGLPEAWNAVDGPAAYSAGGHAPTIGDPRVRLIQGLFADTLPGLSLPERDVLVVNCDADLYSSTRDVLTSLSERLVVGSFLYFDELHDPQHEMKAFAEHLDASGQRWRVVAAAANRRHWAFERIS